MATKPADSLTQQSPHVNASKTVTPQKFKSQAEGFFWLQKAAARINSMVTLEPSSKKLSWSYNVRTSARIDSEQLKSLAMESLRSNNYHQYRLEVNELSTEQVGKAGRHKFEVILFLK